MRILRIYLKLPPQKGGMEKHILRLSKEQQKAGHEVTLAFNRGNKLSPRDIQMLPSFPLANFPFGAGVLVFHVLTLIFLIISGKRYDICHLHGDWHSILFAPLYRWITRGKVSFSFHGAFEQRFITHRVFLKRLLPLSDLVLVNGSESFYQLQAHHKRIYFCPSGIEEPFFRVTPIEKDSRAPFHIVTIANLLPVKNLNTVLKIAEKLQHFKFSIVGEGEERDKLELYISEHGIANVKLAGHQDMPALLQTLSSADVFLLTSLREGTPTAVLEAMAARVPVVSSNAGGLNRFLSADQADIISSAQSVDAYVEALIRLYGNVPFKMQRIEKAHIFSRSFSWQKIAKQITSHMEKIL